MYVVAAYTGLHLGKLLALRWRDSTASPSHAHVNVVLAEGQCSLTARAGDWQPREPSSRGRQRRVLLRSDDTAGEASAGWIQVWNHLWTASPRQLSINTGAGRKVGGGPERWIRKVWCVQKSRGRR